MKRIREMQKLVWRMADEVESENSTVEIATSHMTGRAVAEHLAMVADQDSGELFRSGNRQILIVEPPEFAGVYTIDVDYTPSYTATKQIVKPGTTP